MRAKRFIGIGLVLTVVVMLFSEAAVMRAQEATPTPSYFGDPAYPAPDFPTGLDWLNVSRPLTLGELRGKVVLLDFWTYGCINCMHMMPILNQLEQKFGDALAIIGVHSAKFANEGDTSNIRQVIERYGLTHPVINDHEFAVMLAVQAGEIPQEAFERVIGGMIAQFDKLGEINRDPLPIKLEKDAQPPSTLAFPGKVMVDKAGNRLIIADSSHNRLVVTDLETYKVLDVIGTGAAGLKNGDYNEAMFSKPQGMALKGEMLYVADTENHAIRAVNLTRKTVATIAGTGKQGYGRDSGIPLKTDLSSPWDITVGNLDNLYIAMAGAHQIWVLSMDKGAIGPSVGSGAEGHADGDFFDATLAQPSGLFWKDNVLYFSDAESSSVRAADFTTNKVTTLAGTPKDNLFDFGDVDGELGKSRLQHTLALTPADDGTIFVADTYNSKIKLLDPKTQTIKTLVGLGGTGGFRDGDAAEAQFDEPGGLAYDAGKLYVADTNNDAIRVIDVKAGTVNTVVFPNPEVLQIANEVTVVGGNAATGASVKVDAQTVKAGSGEIELNLALPEGYKLNGTAPFLAEWSSDGTAVSFAKDDQTQSIVAPKLPLSIPVTLSEGKATVKGDLTIYYCEAVKESLCFIDRVTVSIPVTVKADASGTVLKAERVITPPQVQTGTITG